ncbi:MAG: SUMF1/EgtB/PvdO family nonheme iron enzyme [Muribaculaceae bacterium]|nr:SUMF1/EgtB/PvdO family nonheme iron enzyme [Muribaculaceae bacterium]
MSEVSNFLPSGTLLHGGQYSIERHLASGGFGNTYLATDVNLKAKVAIKEFYIKMINYREGDSCTVGVSNADNLDMFHSLREKFKKEAQRIFKIQHNNVVRVYSLFEEYSTVYYAMEFIEGESLNSRLKREGALPESLVRSVFTQMLDALDVVHQAGLLHLDIKPHNIMMTANGVAKLIDFGASKHANQAEATTLTGFAFTPEYAPPELTNQEYDEMGAWTDIYSLGITLYRLLSNAHVPSKKDIRINGAAAFRYNQPVSIAMQQLIVHMTQAASERRPQSVAQLRALAAGLQSEPVPEPIAQPVVPEEKTIAVANPSKKDNVIVPDVKSQVVSTPSVEVPPVTEEKTVSLSKESQEMISSPKAEKKQKAKKKLKSEKKPKAKKKPKVKWILPACIVGLIVLVGAIWVATRSSSSVELIEVPGSQSFDVNGVKFTMVPVEGGTFMMGATAEQGSEALNAEKPAHSVTLSTYYIGQTEVTQKLWEAVMGSNPSHFKGAMRPVEGVNWNDCQEFIKKLNTLTGQNFRLPTEAEWEYAARGGNSSHGYKYSGSNNIDDVAWYYGNSGVFTGQTHDVATKQPNELGLYDMSGNVMEWCQDVYGKDYYSNLPLSNQQGSVSGGSVCRGGGWHDYDPRGCLVANRVVFSNSVREWHLGFRLAL